MAPREHPAPNMVLTREDLKMVGLFLLGLSVVFVSLAFLGYFYAPRTTHEFGVVVDIGSTYIEFNLYTWRNSRRLHHTAHVTKSSTHVCDVRARSYEKNVYRLRHDVFQCMRVLIGEISDFELLNATNFIYGTEATRLFCKQQPARCGIVFDAVYDVIDAFEMPTYDSNSRPLDGVEEAFFGWISVNDFFHRLEKKSKPRFTTLDLKNFSVLLASENPLILPTAAQNPSQRPGHNTTSLHLYGNKYLLHTADFMCYGLSQAYALSLLDLILRNPRSDRVPHPCVPAFHSEQLVTATLWDYCLESHSSDNRLLKSYTIRGRPDFTECTTLVDRILTLPRASFTLGYASLQDTLSSQLSLNLTYAFSEFTTLSTLLSLDQGATLVEFYGKAVNACRAILSSTDVTVPEDQRSLPSTCFSLLYAHAFATSGLGLNPAHVIVGHKSESIETLTGSMTFHSKNIPPRKRNCILGNVGLLSVLLSSVTFLGFALFLLMKLRAIPPEKSHSGM